MFNAAEHLKVTGVKVGASANGGQNALPLTRSPVDGEAHVHQVLDYHLNLLFGCGFLHCDNHKKGFKVSKFQELQDVAKPCNLRNI
jgi:hypothetical protein